MTVFESDLNTSLVEELNKHATLHSSFLSPLKNRPESSENLNETDFNQSTCSSIGGHSMRLSLVPDVTGILSLIDDPSLLKFVNEKDEGDEDSSSFNRFDLNACLEKLKIEADTLLNLSEKMMIHKRVVDNKELDETQKSLEEEDGLKISKDDFNVENTQKPRLSLPNFFATERHERRPMSHSNLNDLKNRLLMAESKNHELEQKLAESLAQQKELQQKLNSYVDSQSEELSEGLVFSVSSFLWLITGHIHCTF